MHNHDHCEHEMAFCKECNVAYCKKCGKEWKEQTWTWFPYQPSTTPGVFYRDASPTAFESNDPYYLHQTAGEVRWQS